MPPVSVLWYRGLRALPRRARFRLARSSPAPTRMRVTLRLRGGIVMQLDLHELLERLIAADSYELAEEDVVGSVLRPGDWVVDVGANIGYNSLRFANLLGRGGRVVAFEPAPPNYDALVSNAARNPDLRVEPHHLALGAAAGTLYLASNRPGQTSGGYSVANDSPGGYDVEQVPLDAWVQEHPLERLRLVKIDVEGFEAEVLDGASSTIRTHMPFLLIEWNPGHGRTEALGRALDDLMGLGYRGFVVTRSAFASRGMLTPLPVDASRWPQFSNILLQPPPA